MAHTTHTNTYTRAMHGVYKSSDGASYGVHTIDAYIYATKYTGRECRSRYELYNKRNWFLGRAFSFRVCCMMSQRNTHTHSTNGSDSINHATEFVCDTMHFSIISTKRKAPHTAVAYSAFPFHRIQFHIIIMRRFRFTHRALLYFFFSSLFF